MRAAFFDVGSVGDRFIFSLASGHSSVDNIVYHQQSRDVVTDKKIRQKEGQNYEQKEQKCTQRNIPSS